MNVYPLTIKNEEGKKVTLTLRLDLSHIRQLKEETGSDPLDLISDAGSGNSLTLAALLGASLNHKNNKNAITDGDELFDLLVDNGVCGLSSWAELLSKVVTISGILTAKQMQGIVRKVKEAEALLEGDNEPAAPPTEENPTTAQTETTAPSVTA